MILPKDFTNNSISYSNNSELKICILAFLFPFQLETSGNLDACTKQIENWAEKLKLEILIYLCIDFIYMYDWYIILTRILLRTQKCIIHGCMLSVKWSMTIFVLNFGGQLVHLDMATRFWTSSRGRPGFEFGLGNVHVWIWCIITTACFEIYVDTIFIKV